MVMLFLNSFHFFLQLSDIKASGGDRENLNLLHYIATILRKRHYLSINDVLQELDQVESASKGTLELCTYRAIYPQRFLFTLASLAAVRLDISELKNGMETIKALLEMFKTSKRTKFTEELEKIERNSGKLIQTLVDEFSKIDKDFTALVKSFGEDAKLTSEEFYGIVSKFLAELKVGDFVRDIGKLLFINVLHSERMTKTSHGPKKRTR